VQRALAAAVIGGLLALLLFVDISGDAAWRRVALDAVHGPIFAAVAMLVATLLGPTPARRVAGPWPDARRYLAAFGIAVLLGGAVEALQSLDDRPGSLFDVGTDAAGAAIGLGLLALLERVHRAPPRPAPGPPAWALLAAALTGLAFLSWRPIEAGRAYLHRARQFPVLASFNAPSDLYFMHTHGVPMDLAALPDRWAQRPGEQALRLRYAASEPPIVKVEEPFPDWRGYSVLVLDLTNPMDRELRLTLRISDAEHDWSPEDRLNLPVVLPPATRSTVRVSIEAVRTAPASRPADLSRIVDLTLFGSGGAGPGELYLSRAWLE
jgi:hypothetical protein